MILLCAFKWLLVKEWCFIIGRYNCNKIVFNFSGNFIVCDCGVCVSFLSIFSVECFEYCVMFCIDLYLFRY